MSRAEWLRTFVAVYRTGSVTVGARSRGLSQPAASQQLGALSRAVGGPVFLRVPRGVTPTRRGRELYARIAEPLDRLEGVLAALDGGRIDKTRPAFRLGARADVFEGHLLPLLADVSSSLVAEFGDDEALVELLLAGEIDLTVTTIRPARRTALDSVSVGASSYVLVAAPSLLPEGPLPSRQALATWVVGQPWVGYSRDSPVTRTFWSAVLARPFAAEFRVVAPDLRAVLAAVEVGLGVSLLPAYVCRRALADGRVVEPYDVRDLVSPEPWFATTRRADSAAPAIIEVLGLLGGATPASWDRSPVSAPVGEAAAEDVPDGDADQRQRGPADRA
jgi:DNA-binding transcriptional LysR family regulator